MAHFSGARIQEQMMMKRRLANNPSTVDAKKTRRERRPNEENSNARKEASSSVSARRTNDGKSRASCKSKERVLQDEPSCRASRNGKERVAASGSRTGRDSSRNKRREVSPKKKIENGSVDEDDIDFSEIERNIFEGFFVEKRNGNSLRKDKTKKDVGRVSHLSPKEEKKKRLSPKEKKRLSPREENKRLPTKGNNKRGTAAKEKREDSNKIEKIKLSEANVCKRDGKNVAVSSKSSKVRRADKEKPKRTKAELKKESTASDSGVSDWEEVDEMEGVDEVKELLSGSRDAQAKSEGVQIELDAPDVLWGVRKRKRRTEEEMLEEYLRKNVNKTIREVHENMHKVHLLCLLAHGRYVNQTLNSDTLLGAALSLVTDKNAYPPKRLDLNYLEKFVHWFSRKVAVRREEGLEDKCRSLNLEETLRFRFEARSSRSSRESTLMFVVVCRALGMDARLVLSLRPMSWRPGPEALIRPSKKGASGGEPSEPPPKETSELLKTSKGTEKRREGDDPGRKMVSSDSDLEVRTKCPVKKGKVGKAKRNVMRREPPSDDEGDSDFDPEPVKVCRGPKSRTGPVRKNSKEGNSTKRKNNEEARESEGKRKTGEQLLEWAEVYVEEEERWICIDVTRAKIHCVGEIEVRMPTGSAYITAFSANLEVRDVSRRYVSSWLSAENKIRCCSEWWEKTLRPFKGRRTRLDKEEEEEMDQNLREQPLPAVIGEYKNHPLYALQRHLLKFEAIYPPDISPVGFIKKEPVYPRDSVYTLCSRDTWMKEAKSVRVDEEPYKIVKARPKLDRNLCQLIKDRPLELFGTWQVEDYVPPVASGGKVPRNEYGNVELFKPSMLPKGCVHIPIANLKSVARKLGIDCAPAMVGFAFHSGWSHPVYDGYVVCEEFRDMLMDAWNQEQAEQAKRAEEKRVKRIYDNWKRLIQGALVRERVRERYGDAPSSDEEAERERERKKVAKKKKITQRDIDAVRPGLVTHQVKNLKIDLTSNVVEMAVKSRKRTMKTKNAETVTEDETDEVDATADATGDEGAFDEEGKKAKIRAILKWENKATVANPDLSDDSDSEKESSPRLSNPPHQTPKAAGSESKEGRKNGESLSDSEGSGIEGSSSRSAAPEAGAKGPRRLARRSAKRKIGTYKESVGQSDEDISIDESDCEDKSYDYKKERKINQALGISDSD